MNILELIFLHEENKIESSKFNRVELEEVQAELAEELSDSHIGGYTSRELKENISVRESLTDINFYTTKKSILSGFLKDSSSIFSHRSSILDSASA